MANPEKGTQAARDRMARAREAAAAKRAAVKAAGAAPQGAGPVPAIDASDRRQQLAEAFVAGELAAKPQQIEAELQEAERVRQRIDRETKRLLAAEHKKQVEREARVREALKKGIPVASVEAVCYSDAIDESIILNEDGTPAGTPGYHKRWVRLFDDSGDDSTSRVDMYRSEGYQPILDKNTRRPKTKRFGMAMEIDPDLEAARKAKKMKGVVKLDDIAAKLQQEAEMDNARANRAIGGVVNLSPNQ